MEALKLTQMANNLDPDFAAPYAQGANCLLQRWAFGWSSGAEDVTEARRLARQATQLDKDHPAVLAVAGAVLAFRRRSGGGSDSTGTGYKPRSKFGRRTVLERVCRALSR